MLLQVIHSWDFFFRLQQYYDLDTELTYSCFPGYKQVDGFAGAQCFFFNGTARWGFYKYPHLNRDKIESILCVPVIQGHQENALIKSFGVSPQLICL